MKSHLAKVLDIYDSIFEDAAIRWPTSIKAFELDKSCLRRAADARGLPFFLVTLPSLGKAIDRSLAHGNFLASEVPQGIPMIKKRPELFGDLYKKVFDNDGTLRQDPDIESVFFLRQFCYCVKKYRVPCPPEATEEILNEFFMVEEGLPEPYPDTWYSDVPVWKTRKGHPLYGESIYERSKQDQSELFPIDPPSLTFKHWDNLRDLSRRVIAELGVPDWWSLRPKHGPGAVSDGAEWKSRKYEFPHWPRKLGLWYPYDWFGSGSIDPESYPDDREPPSRLCAVPKSFKGPRLICIEPVAHQWMQQALMGWLTERVHSTFLGRSIRFDDQERSRKRTLRASVDGRDCTVDLSSASDRLSCRLVEYIFQGSEILDGLHASRTRCLSQTISMRHPRITRLRKFASQGSAVTFPVQSIVFSILSVWALRLAEDRLDDWSNWKDDFRKVTVYGDDIIAPNHAYHAIKLVLHECGLKVNDTKSFFEGNFRESCGMDAFNGVDVTPAYHLESYDGSPSSMATTVEVSNNFHKKGLWRTSDSVMNLLPPKELKLLMVLGGEDEGLGLFSYCGSSYKHLKKVYNRDLQREEYKVLGVSSRIDKTLGTGWSNLTQYFTERPSADFQWSSGQVSRVILRKGITRVFR